MSRIKKIINTGLIKIFGYELRKHSEFPNQLTVIEKFRKDNAQNNLTIFDIGANIGQTALNFNSNFHSSQIYAFEPFTEVFNHLKVNTKAFENINCYKLAMGSKCEKKQVGYNISSHSRLNSLTETLQNNKFEKSDVVEIITGDTFCNDHKIDQIDLLKIDTEGFELEILSGFSDMVALSKIKSIYCEVGFDLTNIRNTYINHIFDFMTKNGFQFYAMLEVRNNKIKKLNNYGNVLFINRKHFYLL